MTVTALTYFSIGAIVLWGGLIITLAISIKKGKEVS